MPNTVIATRAGWITDPSAVIDAVQSALREALKIPEWDRTLRLIEHPASHFAVPPGRGQKFTLVEVTMFSGRSMTAKRTLYQAIVRNLEALGVPTLDIKITLIETRRTIGASAVECRLPKSTFVSRSTSSGPRQAIIGWVNQKDTRGLSPAQPRTDTRVSSIHLAMSGQKQPCQ